MTEYLIRVKPLASGYAASCSRIAGTAHAEVRAVVGQVGHGQAGTEPAAMLAAIVDSRIGVPWCGRWPAMGASGPYVVTVNRPCPEGHTAPLMQGDGGGSDGTHYHTPPCEVCDDRCEVVISRVAVGTLEEARKVPFFTHDVATEDNWGDLAVGLMGLSESGGSVGPLPDGTVIEVESLSPLMLASRCEASGELVMSCLRADDFQPLCEAYNARKAQHGT